MFYNGHRTDAWPGGHANGSDRDSSETERDYRSTSQSDPSSSQTRNDLDLNGFHEPGLRGGSVATLPESSPILPYWSVKRHLTCGNPTPPPPWAPRMTPWRASPAKLKTSNAALVLCLNIDVDPPDVVKTNPCAVLECWVDPHTMPSYKALEVIGTNLQHQFEGLSPKIPYKPILDPSSDDLKSNCEKARKMAGDDTVLFYYNGHGVPKPTPSGELWCFNTTYTQYIPVSISDVQAHLKTPCVYIWDCSAAGHLLNNFITFAKRRDDEANMHHGGYPDPPYSDSIQLAACLADEQLPSCPELPADLFTSCLTSPIDIALRYFIMNHQLPLNLTADMVLQLPGDLKDRRTPLGELNWIFTAITDTIAWTTFSREVFTRLYRSDLLVASLFRNFLLAERIMKDYHCTPHTCPPLPATNTHPLWASWDLAVDACLRQLPELLKNTKPQTGTFTSLTSKGRRARDPLPKDPPLNPSEKPYVYIPSRFFADQLTAFEVWISRGGSALTRRGPMSLPSNGDQYPLPAAEVSQEHHLVPRKPPDQLPIVLQVLLSQPHRLRALILLSQFVDLGPWAVHLALTIGIFPYISRLLQATGQDLRPVLIFIWARILAVDPTCQVDLYNNQGYKYFANVLAIQEDPRQTAIPNSSEHKAMCAFILSAIARDYPLGQNACWRERVFDSCFERLDESDFLLRQWSALCIAQVWDSNDDIRVYGVDRGTQDKLIALLNDDSCEVRAAALYALGTFLGASGSADETKLGGGGSGTMYQLVERIHFRMEVAVVTGAALAIKEDASPMVRKELLVLISCLVKEWRGYFIVCAWIYWEEERRRREGSPAHEDDNITAQAVTEWLDDFGEDDFREENRVLLSSFFTIFSVLLELSVDPYQEVATNAQTVVDYITALLLESPFTRLDSTSLNRPPPGNPDGQHSADHRARAPSLQSTHTVAPPSPNPARPAIQRSETMTGSISSGVTNTLRRTSSFATALKNLAGGIAFPTSEDGRSSPRLGNGTGPRDTGEASRPPSPNLNYAQYTSPYSRPPTPTYPSQVPPSPHPSVYSTAEVQHPQVNDFLPSDVMGALMEEDLERLRARRRAGGHGKRQHHAPGMGEMSSPSGSTFSMDSTNSSVILGLGTGVGIRDVLPLKSRFYDWCVEYFKEPQMRQPEADEPGSEQYNYQVWRQKRNEQIISETEEQAKIADKQDRNGEPRKWDRPVTSVHTNHFPAHIALHAYDPHLVVTDEHDTITVYDWTTRRRLTQFYNGNPRGTSITSLHLINQDVGGMILTGAADGVVRLFRNYDPAVSSGSVQMVSSFRGLNEVLKVKRGSGVVTSWKQSGGLLLVGGDSRIVRVWDAHTESQLMDIDTNCDSPLTALYSQEGTSISVAGFADGTIHVFDRRLEEEDAVVRRYTQHSSWVQSVKKHPLDMNKFLSASLEGEVRVWDLRKSESVKKWEIHQGLSVFDIHEQTGIFAVSSAISPTNYRTQRTMLYPLSNYTSTVSSLSTSLVNPPPREFPSTFIPRYNSLAFHPREMIYAVGSLDNTVRLLGCKLTSQQP
ncbi:hypothetical protein EIP91_003669 [Steccherinum ochraceum]|uniref:Raptor N-terminal CASPase-like domain-containing protein n=1 Tax=Steccherinum ochraceum TaxID=92696 RepID=A0A4V2MW40_9APHY|nr:hypothetical protein EIP91_003669 [Steccherinum ochraceum]